MENIGHGEPASAQSGAQDSGQFIPSDQATAAARRSRTLWMWGLALLAFAVHAYGIMADFVYDDAVMFQQPSASLDWSRIPRSFTTNQSLFFGSNFYRPILNVLYEVTRALFGPRAPAWHVISILLHIACVLLVFRLALKLIDNTLIAGTAAALFAVHPAHVEVISWASAMADMLMTALMLLTVLLFLRWMEQGKMLWWIASFAAGAACIFTKETAVVLPVVLLVTAFALRSRPAPAAGTASVAEPAPAAGAASVAAFPSAAMPDLPVLAATIPFFAITLIYLGLRQHVLGAFSHPLNPSSNAQMIFTWPSALLFYLRHMFWPSAVVPYYPVSIVTGWRGFLLPLITLIAVAAVLGYLLWRSAGWQRFCICLVWILSPLAPALYLKAQAPFDLVHDRFLYAPLVGFCIAAALVLQLATQRIESRTQWRGYPLIAAVLVLLLSIESLSQMVWWQNNLTLFTRAVSVTPNNPRALTGLAEAYLNAGHFDEAVPLLQRALAIDPRHSPALFCMGRIAWMRGDDADAEKYLIQALSIQPRYDIWLHLASVEMHRKQVDAAEDAVRQALAMNPTGIGAHAALGTILLSKGDRPGAAREFRQELRIYPQSDVARMGLERASGNPPH